MSFQAYESCNKYFYEAGIDGWECDVSTVAYVDPKLYNKHIVMESVVRQHQKILFCLPTYIQVSKTS
jgi:hypothetical protein